jgi:hypothetical protein
MSILGCLSDAHVMELLAYHLGWLQRAACLTALQGQWIYALLAALDRLLDADITATLRDILRECAQIRRGLVRPLYLYIDIYI